jgi:LCP family protein required for cell wall assembly
MRDKTHYKEIKVIITVTLLVILMFCVGITFVLKKNHDYMLARDLQINTLNDELNELKNENINLGGEIIKNNNDLKNIYAKLITYNKAITTEKEKNFALEQELSQKINETERTISELAQKNLKLKSELSVSLPEEGTASFLILGQNKGLTDTIMIATANPAKQTVSLISLPRDLFYKGRKINELYHANGIDDLRTAVKEVTGVSTSKYAVFDFSSFEKIVDGIGGIDIDVKKAFTDNAYPGGNFSYRKISFAAGQQHMNGGTALIYARSRESTSDFDRSSRQQQVITAIKNKIMTLNLISVIPTYSALYEDITGNIKTDIGLFELFGYYEQYRDYTFENGNVISTGNFLYSKISSKGQYILLPAGNSYNKIKQYVTDIINT